MRHPVPVYSGARQLRVLALLNADAGRGDIEKIREGIQKGLEETDAVVDFVEVGGRVHCHDLTARAMQDGYGLILVAGGDGTLADAARGVVGQSIPLGVIPAGTGNIVAINLGIPMAPRDAARAAIEGTPEPYDVGRLDDGRIFILSAGAGYDADLIRDADRELKRRFGPLAYLFAMFKNLGVKRARYILELDGREKIHVLAKTVLVTNVGRTMGSLPLAPDARVDDGLLDIVVFTFTTLPGLVITFLKALLGGLKDDPRVRFYQAKTVRLQASRPMPVQVDGELIERTTPISIEVLPGAIRIMRPPIKPPLDLAGLAESAIKAIQTSVRTTDRTPESK
ncbi:MAG: diacylglycerol kinase family lipid kinase [Candidatus Eisenbacteria bacterium]|nr:diacylglycerol kinase family lipid kinase [Candidatus Eisenbacteria bacterium]